MDIMIYRFFLYLMMTVGVCVSACAGVEILDYPDKLDSAYDLRWQMSPLVGRQTLSLLFEGTHTTPAYRLTFSSSAVQWANGSGAKRMAPIAQPLRFPRRTVAITVKRRPGTVAILLDHRLILAAPASRPISGGLRFSTPPSSIHLTSVRYQPIDPPILGDDFMRPDGAKRYVLGLGQWVEDDIWKTAFYQRPNPATTLTDPKTGKSPSNPWTLSLFPTAEKATNGFWLVYTGVGPSWVVARPTLVYPSRDRYCLQVAVKPDYESAVGVIAAYQDAKNYVLFRWHPSGRASAVRAELLAYRDGTPTVLGTSHIGFVPDQWTTLRLALGWRHVSVWGGGRLLVTAMNPGSIEGRVGLYADGAPRPNRPILDPATATMYISRDPWTGQVINESAEATRQSSRIYFDDVRLSPWEGEENLLRSPYLAVKSGKWRFDGETICACAAASWTTGNPSWTRYTATTRIRMPRDGHGGLLFHFDRQRGYAWVITPTTQRLHPVIRSQWQTPICETALSIPTEQWADLRIEVDGPYIAGYCNGVRVFDAFDQARVGGRVGIWARGADVAFTPLAIDTTDTPYRPLRIHAGFSDDRWLSAWASADAEWAPAAAFSLPAVPLWKMQAQYGPAIPVRTTTPGLYWYKGGAYGAVKLHIPYRPTAWVDQWIYLCRDTEQAETGYRLHLCPGGVVELWDHDRKRGTYQLRAGDDDEVIFERRGRYLWLATQAINTDARIWGKESVSREQILAVLTAADLPQMTAIGMQVTTPELPASAITIDSDHLRDAFDTAPTDWRTNDGVWAVMARYSCDPQWSWMGGFGSGTPTLWSHYQLTGDQCVEAYLGVKMLKIDSYAEYFQRYRDLNVSICTDGSDLFSGYTLIRGTVVDGKPATQLLRQHQVVWSSSEPDHLFPPDGKGHREWFTTRLEKHGAEVRIYLDNQYAGSYCDPTPLSGGVAALWTINNGMIVGRVNMGAAVMRRRDQEPDRQSSVRNTEKRGIQFDNENIAEQAPDLFP